MEQSLVSGETLPGNHGHVSRGTGSQQGNTEDSVLRRHSPVRWQKVSTNGLQWDIGLVQWSPVTPQSLGGARAIKITASQVLGALWGLLCPLVFDALWGLFELAFGVLPFGSSASLCPCPTLCLLRLCVPA